MLTQSRLKELLHYNPETGLFTWRISRGGIAAGSIAGCTRTERNYTIILLRADRRLYRAHVLAWLYTYGVYPTYDIDHIDGNSTNNRIANLRDVKHTTNMQNMNVPRVDNKLGLLGASPRKDGKFISQLQFNNKRIFIGVFDTARAAHLAYLATKIKLSLEADCRG